MGGKKEDQMSLFEMKEWWADEWEGMPEYVQDDNMPFKTVYVHFKDREDMEAFSKFIGQRISFKTKFVWYPEVKAFKARNYNYIDGSDEFGDSDES